MSTRSVCRVAPAPIALGGVRSPAHRVARCAAVCSPTLRLRPMHSGCSRGRNGESLSNRPASARRRAPAPLPVSVPCGIARLSDPLLSRRMPWRQRAGGRHERMRSPPRRGRQEVLRARSALRAVRAASPAAAKLRRVAPGRPPPPWSAALPARPRRDAPAGTKAGRRSPRPRPSRAARSTRTARRGRRRRSARPFRRPHPRRPARHAWPRSTRGARASRCTRRASRSTPSCHRSARCPRS
jgi:hypothetical protein